MFTGIIEEIGTIADIKMGAKSCALTVNAKVVISDVNIGDSIAINGVCTTVTRATDSQFSVDIMAETMRKTSFSILKKGDRVNLERAMSANSRFGGHIVSGHIDGTGTIRSMQREDNAVWVTIGANDEIMRYIVKKGSITIDGISLTVASIFKDAFSVSIIPHTAIETTLISKRCGDRVNLECDIIGKYVENFIIRRDESKLEKLLEDF